MFLTLKLLNTLLPLAYGAAALAYTADFFREDPLARGLARPLLCAALAAHVLFLGLRTFAFAHIPLASFPEVLTSVAFGLAAVYLCVESRPGIQKTGMFVLAFSFLFQTLASSFITDSAAFPEILRSPLFAVHTGAAVLGYTAFAVSAIYGVLYLLMYHELKESRFGLVYRRLPPLEVLAALSLRATVLGVALLTLTIGIGWVWAARSFSGFWRDPKFVLTLVVWAVYVTGLALHYGLGWTGRRSVYLSLLGFALAIFSVIAVRLLFTSFHLFA